MIIDCISDLHGYYPKLEAGDLLVVAGDLTARDTQEEHFKFNEWLGSQPYEMKIIIAGNHDNHIFDFQRKHNKNYRFDAHIDAHYLCESVIEFKGLKIWGSPWTKTFLGMNPHCKAFTMDSEEELKKKWDLIPDDIDILITHSPPHGILDYVDNEELCGSVELRNQVIGRIKPKIHIFGHIHECGGKSLDCVTTKFINASYINEYYQPTNNPIRIIL